MKLFIEQFWDNVDKQNAKELKDFFDENAIIRWHNTNEEFTVNEFIQATCEYPDSWSGNIERLEIIDNKIITATKIYNTVKNNSFYANSYFNIVDNKIISLDEYWGNNSMAPEWRINMNIGKPIN